MKRKICALLAVLLLLSIIPNNVEAKKSPRLNYDDIYLQKGSFLFLEVFNYKGKVSFASNHPSICSVSDDGTVLARDLGKAIITAKLKTTGKKLKCKIEVVELSTKKIKFEELPSAKNDQLCFKVINKNTTQVSVEVKIKFYRNGKLVKTDTDSIFSMRIDDWGIVKFYDVPKYDRYKITTVQVDWTNCYITGEHISIKNSSETNDGIVFEVYNNEAKNDIDDIEVVCFMYDKEGKLYHVDTETISQIKGLSTETSTIYYPTDKNGDYIIPDRYELFIIDMYNYDF